MQSRYYDIEDGSKGLLKTMQARSLLRVFEEIGQGDPFAGHSIVESMAYRVAHARRAHPDFVPDKKDGLKVLLDEVEEVRSAIAKDDTPDMMEELLDVVAVCLRMLNFEFSDYKLGCEPSNEPF